MTAADQAQSPEVVGADGLPLRYMPSAERGDPISAAAIAVTGGKLVSRFELLNSRCNGNEAFG